MSLHCSTHWNTHCNTHCNTHYNTHCNTHCNTLCNTHCSARCTTHEIPACICLNMSVVCVFEYITLLRFAQHVDEFLEPEKFVTTWYIYMRYTAVHFWDSIEVRDSRMRLNRSSWLLDTYLYVIQPCTSKIISQFFLMHKWALWPMHTYFQIFYTAHHSKKEFVNHVFVRFVTRFGVELLHACWWWANIKCMQCWAVIWSLVIKQMILHMESSWLVHL